MGIRLALSHTVLGGGISTLTYLTDFECDEFLSARIIIPEGKLKAISGARDPHLFRVDKGAGQFSRVEGRIHCPFLGNRKEYTGLPK